MLKSDIYPTLCGLCVGKNDSNPKQKVKTPSVSYLTGHRLVLILLKIFKRQCEARAVGG